MIAVDTNNLVYAHREDSRFHPIAAECVGGLAEGSTNWAIPWPVVHEFLAIVTNVRTFRTPPPLDAALDQVAAWLKSPSGTTIAEEHGYWPSLREIATSGRVAGAAIHDARIAAICRQHGVGELWSADRDFGRFKGLNVVNPLVR